MKTLKLLSAVAMAVAFTTGAFAYDFDLHGTISAVDNANKTITLKARNKFHLQQWLKIKWHLPNEWQISPSKESCMLLNQYTGGSCLSEKSFTLLPQNLDCGKYEILLEVSSEGRLSKLYIPFVFMNE